jgi:hypothetical protein
MILRFMSMSRLPVLGSLVDMSFFWMRLTALRSPPPSFDVTRKTCEKAPLPSISSSATV